MRKLIISLAVTLMVIMIHSCSIVPITGRRQVNLIPESEMIAMGFSNYSDFMKETPLSGDRNRTLMVKEVGQNISTAMTDYLNDKGLSSNTAGYQWEFNLFGSDVPNAWAMPGGKVAIYEGILPFTRDANGLAVVIGHEIAHIVARHGNERMSQQLLVQLGGIAINEAVSEKPEETRNIFLTVYGVGAQLGAILPYSREHEKEADRLGLIFMAMAGYDPSGAIDFWERMTASGGSQVPEFLSTHPSDATRMADLRKYLPEAMKYYKN